MVVTNSVQGRLPGTSLGRRVTRGPMRIKGSEAAPSRHLIHSLMKQCGNFFGFLARNRITGSIHM